MWGPLRFFIILLLVPGIAVAKPKGHATPKAPVWVQGTVARVVDGDTLALTDGQRVRLLDINAPELAHRGMPAEPFGEAAKARTAALAAGKTVWLRLGPKKYDDYGRLLAHVILPDNSWLNGTLVREGVAVVYTFSDNRVFPRELLGYEHEAREARRGLWTLPRWQVREAATCCAESDIGQFVLVRGVVQSASRGGDLWYLNFGDDYRTDFTVEIANKDFNKFFKKAGVRDVASAYKGREILVHGRAKPVNGVAVKVTHPEQIELVEGTN